ncbi:MAG: Unknown protein [uncultured Sulfurovum sp.]|uniref:Uncharacterized protein n=1 Tax=uncultured Sulfurovum sp. TaxID=269237 RepID=A0A6S6SJX4_9BACT|nr:MAG: Unknown protein [uncultured Sulfurovum sp.]
MNQEFNIQAQLTYTLAIIVLSAIGIFIASKVTNIF